MLSRSSRFPPWLFVEPHGLAHPRLTQDSQHPWALPRAWLHMTWNIMGRGGQDSRQRDRVPFRGPINSLTQQHPRSHSFTRCQIYKVLTCRQGSPRWPLTGFLPNAPFTFQRSGAQDRILSRIHTYQSDEAAPSLQISASAAASLRPQPPASASASSLSLQPQPPASAPSLSPQPPLSSLSLQPQLPAPSLSLWPQPPGPAPSLQPPVSGLSPQPPASAPSPRLKRSRNSIWGHLRKAIPPQPHTKETTSQADWEGPVCRTAFDPQCCFP